ncbi:hypothetical protein BP6252_09847 [Coleophoma cylindrospora]|uniref:Uncharacterized protein n=1 Tax=Coleophoma cylindrospora TaxID=1849047 RepID=A0A3D8QWP5_9HELO|nr:hypothetical protein BP6252_09847 [Coleophoma cylindrospora]
MISSRAVARSARVLRAPIRKNAHQIRFASTEQKQAAAAGGSSGLVGGLVGGGLVFAAGYAYYHFSGAKTIVTTAKSTKNQFDKLTQSMKDSAPQPNEALKWLRSTAQSYAVFIPGAKSYVDTAFNDLDTIEKNHRGEVDEIVGKAYSELKSVSNEGMNLETAQKAWSILEKYMAKLGDLASDSASELLDNHPELKDKIGGNLDQLKSMAKSYGPEAKKELDQTYSQIKDVVAGGVGAGSIAKIKKLIDEKVEKMKKLGDEAWKKGMEQAKPYFDKNPKLKEIVEKNASSLKNGNFGELFEKVKDSASSGNTESLEKYIKDAGEKAKQSGAGQSIEGYVKMIPGAEKIFPNLQKLQEVAKKHGDEAEKLLKETYKDIEDVLQTRVGEAEKLAKKAGKDAKK